MYFRRPHQEVCTSDLDGRTKLLLSKPRPGSMVENSRWRPDRNQPLAQGQEPGRAGGATRGGRRLGRHAARSLMCPARAASCRPGPAMRFEACFIVLQWAAFAHFISRRSPVGALPLICSRATKCGGSRPTSLRYRNSGMAEQRREVAP
jgi:hypothetical protein